MADSSHPWVAAPIAQRMTNAHRVRGCFHGLFPSFFKLDLSSSRSNNLSSRSLSKAKSFWARKAPFRKSWWYRLRPVSHINFSTLLSNCASVRRSKGACICALGSWVVSRGRWEILLLRRFVSIAPKIVVDASRRTTGRSCLCCTDGFSVALSLICSLLHLHLGERSRCPNCLQGLKSWQERDQLGHNLGNSWEISRGRPTALSSCTTSYAEGWLLAWQGYFVPNSFSKSTLPR